MRLFTFTLSVIISFFLFLSCGTESTPTYTLSTSIVGEGIISPSGGTYEEGEVITLSSTPSQHWVFDSWSGDGSGSSSTVTITMDRDKSVVGNFSERLYPLNITYVGEGTVTEEVIQSKSEHTVGTVVQLTPVPENGWKFDNWSGGVTSTDEVVTVTVDGEVNVTVTFTGTIYLGENGITIMCPNSTVGDIGIVNGVEYEVVDRELLLQRIEEGKGSLNRRVCVSKITNMGGLFRDLVFNQPIGDWDVSNVTNMVELFRDSQFNQPIESWNVSNVISMSSMFWGTSFNHPIGNWDVSSVTNMRGVFILSKFNQPIENWDVSNVTNMSFMFQYSEFNQPIGEWDVSKVRDIRELFSGSEFNHPIGGWNVSNVTNMSSMFYLSKFNQSIGDWDVSNVTNMDEMFFRSELFNQNISNWCVWRIGTEPPSFSTQSPLTQQNKPKWGTCPD